MRHFAKHILCLSALALLASSCTERLTSEGDKLQCMKFTVKSTEIDLQAETKATMPGEDQYRENLIKTVHWFVYPGTDTTSNAIMSGVETDLNAIGSSDLSIFVDNSQVLSVFPRTGSGKCIIYTIVNLPSSIELPSNTSISSLRSTIALSDNFAAYTKNGNQAFVMDGRTEVKVVSRTANIVATGTVPVYRVATKFTLCVSVADSAVDANGQTWYPQRDQMWVKFYNCVSNAQLTGLAADNASPEYFSYPANPRNDGDARTFVANGEGGHVCAPFYTYPSKWEYNSKQEPYFVVMLPWKRNTDIAPRAYYYKVLLSDKETIRNTWYHIDLNLAVLGSLEETNPPVVVEQQYHVCDWSDEIFRIGNSVDAIFKAMRYLVVPTTEFVLDDKETLDIEYFSSNQCEIVDVTCSKPVITGVTESSLNLSTQARSWFSLEMVGETTYIRFNHDLQNEQYDSNYDYTRYDITLRIRHTDMPETYYEDIRITQYPALTVEMCRNSNANSPLKANNGPGYVIINNKKNASNEAQYYGGSNGMTSTSEYAVTGNTNPNMYTIRTTALPSDSKYIIADPRKREVDNLSGWSPATANVRTVVSTATRQLKYYHPTITTADAEMKIAPKFRIASSFGKTYAITYETAKKRCATYQEDGYPAGRWRLGTRAEIEYVIHLSTDNKIPELFKQNNRPTSGGKTYTGTDGQTFRYNATKDLYYWCASGLVFPWSDGTVSYMPVDDVYTNFSSTITQFVRCVYDDWYWEQTDYPRITPASSYSTFMWGDIAEVL